MAKEAIEGRQRAGAAKRRVQVAEEAAAAARVGSQEALDKLRELEEKEAEKREKTARLEYRLDLDEVSSRLVGAHQKMQRKGVVAVKVQHFSFADEALERAIPPPPRFPHKPQKKVHKKGLEQKKGASRGGSIWDEKSVRSFRERPLSARPASGVRVEASDWFRPQSARGANEDIEREKRSRLGRHLESTAAQRPVGVADWLREQEELDSSGAEQASDSPGAHKVLGTLRGPLSRNQTSKSYVQRLERMLVSLRGQLEGRSQGGGREERAVGGELGSGEEEMEMGRSDGVFAPGKVADARGGNAGGAVQLRAGSQDRGLAEDLEGAPSQAGSPSSNRRGDGGSSSDGSPRTTSKEVTRKLEKGDGRHRDTSPSSVSVDERPQSLQRHPTAHPTASAIRSTAAFSKASRQLESVDGRAESNADGLQKVARTPAWPELGVGEEDYRRALGIAPRWDPKPHNPEAEPIDGEEGGSDVRSHGVTVRKESGDRNEIRTRSKSGKRGDDADCRGLRSRRGSRSKRDERSNESDVEYSGSGSSEEGYNDARNCEQTRGAQGGNCSSPDAEETVARAGGRTGVWEHVAGPGMSRRLGNDGTGGAERGNGGQSTRSSAFGRRRRSGGARTADGSRPERGQTASEDGGEQGDNAFEERYRGDSSEHSGAEESDDSRSSARDVSGAGLPQWVEESGSRQEARFEGRYEKAAYEDDPEDGHLETVYYSDGEMDQREEYAMDGDAAYSQRPKSAGTFGRPLAATWQEESDRGGNGGGASRAERSSHGGVESATFLGGMKGPYQLATEHNLHRNCVRYMGVPRGATVPQPFKFDERERLRQRSIAETRIAQDIALKGEVEWWMTKSHFRANPLPRSTVLPRYAKLSAARERRRQEVHQRSTELLRSMERPFSFYNRDTLSRTRALSQSADHQAARERRPGFKANPVPAAVKVKKFDLLVKEMELKRELRKRRALEELKNSKLPPRMEMHEKEKDKTQPVGTTPSIEGEASFKPRVNRTVPDFEKLHQRFKASLERAKAELPTTKPEAFSFFDKPSLSARKKEKIHRDIDQDDERLPEQRWPFMAPRTKIHPTPPPAFEPPAYAPAKTLAVKLKELKVKEEMAQGLYDNREQREKRKAEQLKKETARRKALWEAFQKQSGTRMSRSASYRASRSKKGTWRGWDSLSSNEPSTDMHRMARMKQEEERAREIVEQALMDNGLPFSLDEILDA